LPLIIIFVVNQLDYLEKLFFGYSNVSKKITNFYILEINMATNQYKAKCVRCKKTVKPKEGTVEKVLGGWDVWHVTCRVKHITKEQTQEAEEINLKIDNLIQ